MSGIDIVFVVVKIVIIYVFLLIDMLRLFEIVGIVMFVIDELSMFMNIVSDIVIVLMMSWLFDSGFEDEGEDMVFLCDG